MSRPRSHFLLMSNNAISISPFSRCPSRSRRTKKKKQLALSDFVQYNLQEDIFSRPRCVKMQSLDPSCNGLEAINQSTHAESVYIKKVSDKESSVIRTKSKKGERQSGITRRCAFQSHKSAFYRLLKLPSPIIQPIHLCS